jgi:hypothetical protein
LWQQNISEAKKKAALAPATPHSTTKLWKEHRKAPCNIENAPPHFCKVSTALLLSHSGKLPSLAYNAFI